MPLCKTKCNLCNGQLIYEAFDYVLERFGDAFVLESMATDFLNSDSVKAVAINQIDLHIQDNYIIVNKDGVENEGIKALLDVFKESTIAEREQI